MKKMKKKKKMKRMKKAKKEILFKWEKSKKYCSI
jgi:hypothetical protein